LVAFLAVLVMAIGAAARPLAAVKISIADPIAAAGAAHDEGHACPRLTVPDGEVCVRVPRTGDPQDVPEAAEQTNAHQTRAGRWQRYEEIPRRPDRPADYDAYRYPVPPAIPGGHTVVSGYDLDKADDAQRRGRTLRAVGHGGVDLPGARGTPARMIPLEQQQGDADVLFVGPLFGTTVITRHAVREGGRAREYVVLWGHLDAVSPGVHAGSTLKEGDVVGLVGDTGSPELVHLHWEARRVREGVDVVARAAQGGAALLSDDVSVVCDPRNVLPLR